MRMSVSNQLLRGQFSELTFYQGIEGDVKLSGSSIELDEFTIRVVDGSYMHFIPSLHSQCVRYKEQSYHGGHACSCRFICKENRTEDTFPRSNRTRW
jgi:hypothetical protein